MCGLIGMMLKDNKNKFHTFGINVFKELLYVGAVRGQDGTGLAAINGKEIKIHKDNCFPETLFKQSTTWENDNKILLGHNRKTTHGNNIKEHGHPFKEGNITLIHNGMIRWHKIIKDVAVDSHAICHGINETNNLSSFLGSLEGFFALIWYNSKEEAIYLTRNDTRPLYIINTKDVVFFVSELNMGIWILGRYNIPILSSREVKPDTIYKYYYKKNTLSFSTSTYEKKKNTFVKESEENIAYFSQYDKAKQIILDTLKIKFGQLINIIPIKKIELSYKMYGDYNIRWDAQLADNKKHKVEFYTKKNEDFTGKVLKVKFRNVFTTYQSNNYTIYTEEPVQIVSSVQDYEAENIFIDEFNSDLYENGVVSKNYLYISGKDLRMLSEKNKQCCITHCTEEFAVHDAEESVLIPVLTRTNEIVDYTYFCPNHAGIGMRKARKEYHYG